MTIYWTLKSIPELAPLTRKQRRRVHEECLRRHFWHAPATRRSMAAYACLIGVTAGGWVGGQRILLALGLADNSWVLFGLSVIGALAGLFVFLQFAIPVLRPFYREFIERENGRVL